MNRLRSIAEICQVVEGQTDRLNPLPDRLEETIAELERIRNEATRLLEQIRARADGVLLQAGQESERIQANHQQLIAQIESKAESIEILFAEREQIEAVRRNYREAADTLNHRLEEATDALNHRLEEAQREISREAELMRAEVALVGVEFEAFQRRAEGHRQALTEESRRAIGEVRADVAQNDSALRTFVAEITRESQAFRERQREITDYLSDSHRLLRVNFDEFRAYVQQLETDLHQEVSRVASEAGARVDALAQQTEERLQGIQRLLNGQSAQIESFRQDHRHLKRWLYIAFALIGLSLIGVAAILLR